MLVLLVDAGQETREVVQGALARHGLQLVQTRSTLAALDLLQRLPKRFRLVIVNLEMPGLSGRVLLETLRLFRPELPVLCLSAPGALVPTGGACLSTPVQTDELRARLDEALAGVEVEAIQFDITPEAVARARASFTVAGNLLDAARELARGIPGESASDW
jgi:DNA-binding response OmpR family regulator